MARKKGKKGSGSKDDRNDWHRFNKFKEENEKLRKEVSKLRKLVDSVLVDRLQKKQDRVDNNESAIEPVCERCGNTDLVSIPISRPDGKFEIITCKSCNHRSPLKKMKEPKQE